MLGSNRNKTVSEQEPEWAADFFHAGYSNLHRAALKDFMKQRNAAMVLHAGTTMKQQTLRDRERLNSDEGPRETR